MNNQEPTIEFQDPFPLEGSLSIYIEFQDGTRFPFLQNNENVILDASKAHLLGLIYDQNKSVQPDPITGFILGDGGTLDGTPSSGGPGGSPGSNSRPLSGAETSLFNKISESEYDKDVINHTLENTTTANKGTWAANTGYNLGDKVTATSPLFSNLVFEATTAGTSGSTEPSWPSSSGQTVTDNTVTWTARYRALASQTITYSFNISSSQLNGYFPSEAALVKESGDLFNFKTFPSIPKSSSFSIQFLWTIKYV